MLSFVKCSPSAFRTSSTSSSQSWSFVAPLTSTSLACWTKNSTRFATTCLPPMPVASLRNPNPNPNTNIESNNYTTFDLSKILVGEPSNPNRSATQTRPTP
ncbi:hypothetical protein CR513_19587, partial [Mucuna pruriens]